MRPVRATNALEPDESVSITHAEYHHRIKAPSVTFPFSTVVHARPAAMACTLRGTRQSDYSRTICPSLYAASAFRVSNTSCEFRTTIS